MTNDEAGVIISDLRVALDALEDFAHDELSCTQEVEGEPSCIVSRSMAERTHLLIRLAAQLARKLEGQLVEGDTAEEAA